MAGTNQFYPFASGPGANALTAAAWAALATRQSGFASGIAPSVQFNTAWRQPANMASMIGAFIAARNLDALDDGDINTLRANFEAALLAYAGSAVPDVQRIHTGQDTGPANVITSDVAPNITAYTFLSFYLVRIAATNTGPTTANFDGVGALPLRRRDGSELQAGDLLAGTIVALVYDGTIFRLLDLALGEVPRILASPVLYVRTDGSDNNDGSANNTANAVASLSRALAIASKLYLTGSGITIQLGVAGTYQLPAALPQLSGTVTIQGSTSAQSTYILSNSAIGAGAGNAIEAIAQTVNLVGLTLSNSGTGSNTATSSANGTLTLRNVTVQAVAGNTGGLIYTSGGVIQIQGGCVATSGANSLFGCRGGNLSLASGATFSVVGTPTFALAVAAVADVGVITMRPGASISGTSNAPSYLSDTNSVIRTSGGGANFFKGSSAGSVANGGIYLP